MILIDFFPIHFIKRLWRRKITGYLLEIREHLTSLWCSWCVCTMRATLLLIRSRRKTKWLVRFNSNFAKIKLTFQVSLVNKESKHNFFLIYGGFKKKKTEGLPLSVLDTITMKVFSYPNIINSLLDKVSWPCSIFS